MYWQNELSFYIDYLYDEKGNLIKESKFILWNGPLGIYENGNPVSSKINIPFGSRTVNYEYVPTETRTFDILIYVNEKPEINDVKQITIYVDSYNITATADPDGSISPAGQVSVDAGTDQRFDITPSFGYQIADVIVDGQSKGAITSYTFSNVHSDHQIHAIFAEGPLTSLDFLGALLAPL